MIDDVPFCGTGIRPGPRRFDPSLFGFGATNPAGGLPGLGGLAGQGVLFH